ncbi:MAG: type 1 periplasmic binding fold superfamily protein [Microscillaceae bacterium]|nr:type 1 periplasmic binding fold superfamily protein [Microscillaceae bacterium]
MKLFFKNNFLAMAMLLNAMVLLSSCGDDDAPLPPNEEEIITTLRLEFTKSGTAVTQTFEWQDLDGDGGNAPVIDAISLDANSTYDVKVLVLNETEPVDLADESYNITLEIEEEDDEHQFFFIKSAGLNLTFTYDDEDDNGNPVGLDNTFSTGAASTGTLTVTLKHQPGIKTGTSTINDGETDIEATFGSVTIQ